MWSFAKYYFKSKGKFAQKEDTPQIQTGWVKINIFRYFDLAAKKFSKSATIPEIAKGILPALSGSYF